MSGHFDYFVVFAEMRTGSNFLESNLNALEGVACHGEAFNPHFIGYPTATEILGITQDMRDGDPLRLLKEIRKQKDTLSGFRYFHDHDPRILDRCLDDARCAKIILTRNPADSYVSWKIAQATGQWKLTDMKARKDGKAEFVAEEFETHIAALQGFQVQLMHRLQITGQTAFYIDYDDLQNVDVMNGLAAWLGVDARLDALDKTLKKQNPSALGDKVANFEQMQATLSGIDRFNLTRTPNFEPRRGPVVPSYVACAQAPLLYLPMKDGVDGAIEAWMAALDNVPPADLRRKMSQKDLRQWKRQSGDHRCFAIVRHPVARAHHAFCRYILATGSGTYPQLRQTLRRRYNLPIPEDAPGSDYDRAAHRAAFVAFLEFLKGNLTGQTAIRVDSAWCSQAQALQGFAEFAFPDVILRDTEMAVELPRLAARLGLAEVPDVPAIPDDSPFALADIHDAEIEKLAHAAYQRDYMMFGFSDWRPADR